MRDIEPVRPPCADRATGNQWIRCCRTCIPIRRGQSHLRPAQCDPAQRPASRAPLSEQLGFTPYHSEAVPLVLPRAASRQARRATGGRMAYIRSDEYGPTLVDSGCDARRWTTRCRTQDFGLAATDVRQVWNPDVRPDWTDQALHDVPPPPLIKRETQPPSSTLYVNIALGSEGPA